MKAGSSIAVSGEGSPANYPAGLIEITVANLQPVAATVLRPWPFLDSYSYSDEHLLFGRDVLKQAIGRYIENSSSGLLILHGASGSGKSSLLNAFAVPRLIRGGSRVFVDHCLKYRLTTPTSRSADWKRICSEPTRMAIVLDQFEELFIMFDAEIVKQFLLSIEACVREAGFYFILGVRREFYSDLSGHMERLGLRFESVHIPRLGRQEALAALTVPAGLMHLTFEDGLVSRIVNDLRMDTVTRNVSDAEMVDPPQLQIVLDCLYRALRSDRSNPTVITHASYDILDGAQGCLHRFLLDRIAQYAPHQRDIAQTILKRMVTDQLTKKPLGLTDVKDVTARYGGDPVIECIARLQDDRLLRTIEDSRQVNGENDETTTYELSHDYLTASIATWVDDREKPLRLINSQLEKYYPLIDTKHATVPLSKPQYQTYFRELREEASKFPDWSNSLSGAAICVLAASSLHFNEPADLKWLSISGASALQSVIGELARLAAIFGKDGAKIDEIGLIAKLKSDDILECIRLSVIHGTPIRKLWLRQNMWQSAMKKVVDDVIRRTAQSTHVRQRKLRLQAQILSGVLGDKWPVAESIEARFTGTALADIHLFAAFNDVSRKTIALRNLLLRRYALVPAGEFCFGDSAARKRLDNPVKMSITPVVNGQYAEFVSAGGYTDPELLRRCWSQSGLEWLRSTGVTSPDERFWNNPLFNLPDKPVVGVCLYEAEAYAKFVGGRLPSEIEWERAARGDDDRPHPWGYDLDAKYCLIDSNDDVKSPSEVGRYPAGASPYGLLDLCGNVWEWTSTMSESPNNYILRGGSMQLNQGIGKCWSRSHREAPDRYYFRGFRVAWDV